MDKNEERNFKQAGELVREPISDFQFPIDGFRTLEQAS